MSNDEIFKMHGILVPFIFIAFHLVGSPTAVHPLWLAIIIGFIDIIGGSALMSFIITATWLNGHLDKFRNGIIISVIIMLAGAFTFMPPSWMGVLTTVLLAGEYALMWVCATNNPVDEPPTEEW